eukprot:scaffold18791_cov123-Skeletonema_marinoi.AAC.1
MTSAEQSFSKAGYLAALIITCFSSSSSFTQAFQSSSHAVQRGATISNYSSHTSALFADGGRGFGSSDSNNGGGGNNKKNGKKPKYTIEDKSYGSSSSSSSSSSPSAEMMINNQTPEEFFTTYIEWMPLFREYKQHSLAHSFLTSDDNTQQQSDDTLWGISTLENRNPW